jgi:hypothetical protein
MASVNILCYRVAWTILGAGKNSSYARLLGVGGSPWTLKRTLLAGENRLLSSILAEDTRSSFRDGTLESEVRAPASFPSRSTSDCPRRASMSQRCIPTGEMRLGMLGLPRESTNRRRVG